MREKKERTQLRKPRKKVYRSPELVVFGEVKVLTRGGGSHATDGGAAITKSTCWIAEAIYGVDTPRVILVRAWLVRCYERADWWALGVVPLYRRFGERVAEVVRFHAWMRRCLRPVFDFAVRCAYCDFLPELIARRARK